MEMGLLLWLDSGSHQSPPYSYVLPGVVFICAAVIFAGIGKAGSRGGWVSRAEEPTQFWLMVVLYLLTGIGFIAYSWYLTFGFSG
jgi:hypothetical protein